MWKVLFVVFAVALLVAAPAAAVTPHGQAVRTRDCLRAHGWTAVLTDRGATVNAKAPRKLVGYPGRPWYSVSFYDDGTGRVRSNENRIRLNRAEGRLATRCRIS